jgi:cytochrome c-type biogenesis protein CcmH/NrfG
MTNAVNRVRITVLAVLVIVQCGCSSTPEKTKAFTRLEMADHAYAQGRWVEAEQHYQAITQQVPNDFYAWFRMGNARLRQGNVDAAISAYQAGLQRDSRQPKLQYNLAEAYLLLAYRSMQSAYELSTATGAERSDIEQRLNQMYGIIYKPIRDMPSPARGLIRN